MIHLREFPMQDSSVQFSHLVVSDSLPPRGLHYARLEVHGSCITEACLGEF